ALAVAMSGYSKTPITCPCAALAVNVQTGSTMTPKICQPVPQNCPLSCFLPSPHPAASPKTALKLVTIPPAPASANVVPPVTKIAANKGIWIGVPQLPGVTFLGVYGGAQLVGIHWSATLPLSWPCKEALACV